MGQHGGCDTSAYLNGGWGLVMIIWSLRMGYTIMIGGADYLLYNRCKIYTLIGMAFLRRGVG